MAILETVTVFWKLDCGDMPEHKAMPIRYEFAKAMLERHAAPHEHFAVITELHAFGSITPSRIGIIQSLAEGIAEDVGCKAIPVSFYDVYPAASRPK